MKTTLIPVCTILCAIGIQAQDTKPQQPDATADVKKQLKQIRQFMLDPNKSTEDKEKAASEIQGHLLELARMGFAAGSMKTALADFEIQRIDKQTGSTPNSSGTTSLVEKGTVPFLLGLAVENGAVSRTTDGTTLTFQARTAALIKFLGNQDFVKSAVTTKSSPWVQAANKLTLGVSFDVSRGSTPNEFTGTRNQVSGYSFHYDIRNRRDSRDARYEKDWTDVTNVGRQAAQTGSHIGQLMERENRISGSLVAAWYERTRQTLLATSVDQVENAVDAALDNFEKNVAPKALQDSSELRAAVAADIAANNAFAMARRDLATKINNSLTAAVEYAVVRQSPPADSTSTTTMASTGASITKLPDLGTLRLILAKGFGQTNNLTLNASMTNFSNTFRSDRIRDYQVGLQFDAPVTQVKDWGQISFSLAGLFLDLRQQPLGETVMVNNIVINSTGKIGFAQAKLEVPIGTTGIRLPFALTWASQNELLANDKNKFGANIGLTFDLDKLLAQQSKPK